jgi:hypothetical protein
MADNIIGSFLVALGFDDAAATSMVTKTKKSMADYERAVKQAEKNIEDAKWAAAKSGEEIAKLTRETNLRLAREALQNAKDQEKREKDAADKRKEHNRKLLADFEKLALAAGAAATAIGYAVAKITGAFDNLYFQAQRSGTSVQSLKALGYAFSQTGGTAQQAGQAVDSFTAALRNNPGLRQFVKDLGVDGNLQGADKLIATLDALKKEPYEVGVQHAGMLGISEDTFNQYVRQGDALKRYRDEYNATARSLGVDSDKAAEAATSFQRTLSRLQATVSALSDKLLISLAPALQKIAQRFQDWIAANPEKVEKILDGISRALTWVAEKAEQFGEWILGSGGDLLMKRWENFAERVERVARAVELIATGISKVLGLVERLSGTRTPWGDRDRLISGLNQIEAERGGGGGGSGGDGGGGSDDRSWWQRHAPRALGGRDAPSLGTQDAVPGAAGTYRPQRTLTERDLSDGVVNTIAGEARLGTAGGADAVINNMFNRLGTTAWGPGRDLHDVARAPGQYAGYRQANEAEAKYIRDRIRAIAAGSVPDNTNGSNSFRASWYRGPWYQRYGVHGRDVGGNTFAYDPNFRNGPYAPYTTPRTTAPATAAPTAPARTPGNFDPNNIDPANLTPPAPAAASPTTNNNNNTNNRSVQQNINNNVTIQGAGDPRQMGRIMEGSLSRVHSLALSNAQSAVV